MSSIKKTKDETAPRDEELDDHEALDASGDEGGEPDEPDEEDDAGDEDEVDDDAAGEDEADEDEAGEDEAGEDEADEDEADDAGEAARASAPKLPGAALRHLRALGHTLSPVVSVGKEGVTPSLVAAVEAALGTHELIKVKVQREAPLDRSDAAEAVARASQAVLAQVLGRTFLLYKKHPKKPKIRLPGSKTPRS